ncbi:hypothetical protein FRC12_002896 [Ceratobasidium sp. 428]|nr:hypothetical protein FRC12_002896 [Ceratobasidium sp. 428]
MYLYSPHSNPPASSPPPAACARVYGESRPNFIALTMTFAVAPTCLQQALITVNVHTRTDAARFAIFSFVTLIQHDLHPL